MLMVTSSLGHQPEWGSEAKNLCGTSSLSKYQHCLFGENMPLFLLHFSLWTNEPLETSQVTKGKTV